MDGVRPRRLWLLAAAFAVAGVLLLYPPGDDADAPATGGPPQSPAPDQPTGDVAAPPVISPPARAAAPSPDPTGPAQTPAAGEPEPWLPAVAGYAEAFTARAADHAEWVAGLEPWVSHHLADQYERTHPARRPRGAVDSVETVTPGDYSAHVEVTYDTGLVLMVRVANRPDGWRVTYVEPVAGT